MDIYIFIALLIYLFLFNENKVIKRLLLIYLIIYILCNLYKCFFKKIIEGADNIGEPIDYNKNIYNILNDNILLLQDVNSLKQYEKKLKDDIINVQTNLKTNVDTLKVNIDKKQNIGDDINFKSKNINNKGYISATDNGLSLDFKAPESNKIFKLKDIPTNPNDIATKFYVDNFVKKWYGRITKSQYFVFGSDNELYFFFNGDNLYLRSTLPTTHNFYVNGTLISQGLNIGVYVMAHSGSINNNNSMQVSTQSVGISSNRGVNGVLINTSLNHYYRFFMNYIDTSNVYYFVERVA